jgi:hypothetical protein
MTHRPAGQTVKESDASRAPLSRARPRRYITAEEEAAFDSTREWSDAGSGSVASKLVAGGCVALIGDAAVSPPPPGQVAGTRRRTSHTALPLSTKRN